MADEMSAVVIYNGDRHGFGKAFTIQRNKDDGDIAGLLGGPILHNAFLHHLRDKNGTGRIAGHGGHRRLDRFGWVVDLSVYGQQLRGGGIVLLGEQRAEVLRNVSGGHGAGADPVGLRGRVVFESLDT